MITSNEDLPDIEILDCPFCAGSADLVTGEEPGRSKDAQVMCDHCCAAGPMYTTLICRDGTWDETLYEIASNAIAEWNKAKR